MANVRASSAKRARLRGETEDGTIGADNGPDHRSLCRRDDGRRADGTDPLAGSGARRLRLIFLRAGFLDFRRPRPDLIKSGFVTQAQVSWIGSVTVAGLFVGTLGQGEFTDRFGRKAVYQFNLLLFGLGTIIAALPPIPSIGFDPGLRWLLVFRFLAGVGLGAEQPLCFSYTAEYAPKNIRGRLTAFMQFLGGAWPWPVGVLLTLTLPDSIGWRGIWIIIGIGALVIFVLRFSLPESPRWLATHGQGQRALDLLQRMGLRTVPLASLRTGAASDTKSDPLGIVLREYPGRVIAGMICFFAFFGIALGLGAWLPNILFESGLTFTK